jgi:F0F1-type ATP synthase assembly protein I
MSFHRPIPDAKQRSKFSSGVETLVQAEKLMQIALLLPSAAFIGWLAGAWADHCFHTSWIGLAGIVFGGVSGLVYVVRLALTAEGDPRNVDESDSEDKAGDENGKGSTGPKND